MELDHEAFESNLIPMLEAVSGAHFVSIDLEFSGIAHPKATHIRSDSNGATEKPNLQQRYEEIRKAAEKYQILQVGLTIVQEDTTESIYRMRPYNMYLNPLIKDDQINVLRDVTFQNHATNFLLNTPRFDLGSLFNNGVLYLSREEEKSAFLNEARKNDKSIIPNIIHNINDQKYIDFITATHTRVKNWVASKSTPTLSIGPGINQPYEAKHGGLNPLQRRLIHELVKNEFPFLSSRSAGGSVIIYTRNAALEAAARESQAEIFKRRVQRQKGLSWLIEGLTRGSLRVPNPMIWLSRQGGRPIWLDSGLTTERFAEIRSVLRSKPTVLVGHNVFVDLVYFYAAFIGKLPARVEQFAGIIHKLFPRVIDTKFMATYDEGDSRADSDLQSLYVRYGTLDFPLVEVDPAHVSYNESHRAHEAGWDSFATAVVLVRLSALIESCVQEQEALTNAQGPEEPETTEHISAPDRAFTASATVTAPAAVPTAAVSIGSAAPALSTETRSLNGPSPGDGPELRRLQDWIASIQRPRYPSSSSAAVRPSQQGTQQVSHQDQGPKPGKEQSEDKQDGTVEYKHRSPLGHPTNLSGDLVMSLDGAGDDEAYIYYDMTSSPVQEDLISFSSDNEPADKKDKGKGRSSRDPFRFMPDFESDFWEFYGNKLRVNGTIEGELYLGDWDDK